MHWFALSAILFLSSNVTIQTLTLANQFTCIPNSPWQRRGRAPAQRYADRCSCASPPQRAQRHMDGGSAPCSANAGAGIGPGRETQPDPAMLHSGRGWSASAWRQSVKYPASALRSGQRTGCFPPRTHIFRDEVASDLNVTLCNHSGVGGNDGVQSEKQEIAL